MNLVVDEQVPSRPGHFSMNRLSYYTSAQRYIVIAAAWFVHDRLGSPGKQCWKGLGIIPVIYPGLHLTFHPDFYNSVAQASGGLATVLFDLHHIIGCTSISSPSPFRGQANAMRSSGIVDSVSENMCSS